MSGYGGTDNPFEDNPFSDPSVQRVTGTSTNQAGLDTYNPFDGTKNQPVGGRSAPAHEQPPPYGGQPAVVPTYQETYNPSQPNAGDLLRRQDELEKKADELQKREQEMRKQQQANAKANNWPPLPNKCPVGPCFYHDITVEIPLEFQRIVRYIYYLWMFYACVLALNVLGALSYLIGGGSGSATTFGVSILFFILFTPCSFVCWYRPVYKAFRSDSSLNFFIFFFIFFFQIIVTIIQAIGIGSWGSCGWIVAISAISRNVGVGIVMLFISLLFTIVAIVAVVLLKKVHSLYRTTGASMQKAQTEFATDVMSNQAVQRGAAQAVRTSAQNQFSGGRT